MGVPLTVRLVRLRELEATVIPFNDVTPASVVMLGWDAVVNVPVRVAPFTLPEARMFPDVPLVLWPMASRTETCRALGTLPKSDTDMFSL